MKLLKTIFSLLAIFKLAQSAKPTKNAKNIKEAPKMDKLSIIKMAPELKLKEIKIEQPKVEIKVHKKSIAVRQIIYVAPKPIKNFKAGEVCYRSTPNWREENGMRKCPEGYSCRPKEQPKPIVKCVEERDPETGKIFIIRQATNPVVLSGAASYCQKIKGFKPKPAPIPIIKVKTAKKGEVCYKPVPNFARIPCEQGLQCAHKPLKPGEMRMSGESSYCMEPKEKKIMLFLFPYSVCNNDYKKGQINKMCPPGFECGWANDKKKGQPRCRPPTRKSPIFFIPANERCAPKALLQCTPGTVCTKHKKGYYCLPQLFRRININVDKSGKVKKIHIFTTRKSYTTWTQTLTKTKTSKKVTKSTKKVEKKKN